MMMSEEEARKKWCPHVRVAGDNRHADAFAGSIPQVDAPYLCVGSDCMAWRNSGLRLSHSGGMSDTAHGYCGLAGVPPTV